jgi:4-diphosphocytidyl-2-C-methyl-D-erythritol kinase
LSTDTSIFKARARAKINLTLHVGAVQDDGYHPVHSLVVFADIGDDLTLNVSGAQTDRRLMIDGPFAQDLTDGPENSVMRVAMTVKDTHQGMPHFHLTKNLPVASGIGGGSADGAAAHNLLKGVYLAPQDIEFMGADFDVCARSTTCVMQGIGEDISPLKDKGQMAALLINPGVEINTGQVFQQFDKVGKPSKPHTGTQGSLLALALKGRNDLQDIALEIAPVIQTVLDEISAQAGCQLARMSGSGATCFGLFDDIDDAMKAVKDINSRHPDWWCVSTTFGDAP